MCTVRSLKNNSVLIKFYAILENIEVKKHVTGAALTVNVVCGKCKFETTRSTSSKKGDYFIINYLLSCAILFVGGLPTQMIR